MRAEIRCVSLSVLAVAVPPSTFAAEENAIAFFVAPDGDDGGPGTGEHPFGSLEAARDAIRRLKRAGPLAAPAFVWIRGGTYVRERTFTLKPEDAGTAEAPIVYRACEGQRVRITGGRSIDASRWKPVEDPAILARIDEGARGKVLAVDLRAQGIADVGAMSILAPMLELFVEGRRLPLARWPNAGWAPIGDVVTIAADGSASLAGENPRGKSFRFEGDRPLRWRAAREAVLHGFWFYGWLDQHVAIERIDPERREIVLAETPGGGIKKGQWFRALNLIEEIDEPGEWVLERSSGIAYLYPPPEFPASPIVASTLEEPLIVLDGTSHTTIRGLILEVTRGVGAVVGGGEENRLAGCTIRGIGSQGVIVDGGKRNGLLGCDIHDIGGGGVRVTGGNRSTLAPAEDYVVNCHIHEYAQRKKVYEPAVRLYGVGHRVAHNRIHDAPHQAIGYDGNDHAIEFNEIHDVVLETSDAGALYTGCDWTFRGNAVRHNFFHHIPFRPGFGSKVVYIDDCASSTDIIGNIFYKARECAFVGGGRDNRIENNIFIDCEKPVHLDTRGLTWEHFRPEGPMYEKLRRVPFDRPPWSIRYPALARILDEHPQAPLGNTLARNVSVRSTWGTPDARYFAIRDNYLTGDDPGFADAANMDFALRDDSIIYERIPGFRRIPFERIGLYPDKFRASWPVARRGP
ncbi:MAG: right-handed parallel beta-helix repeat-containing protein [Planctomycetes bacterium]|nr:right-handed parallel beta-helix repeat-containing protein [Planctomycetota bacterium]